MLCYKNLTKEEVIRIIISPINEKEFEHIFNALIVCFEFIKYGNTEKLPLK